MWLLIVVAGIVGLCVLQQFDGQVRLSAALLGLAVLIAVVQYIAAKRLLRAVKRNNNRINGSFF